jgi:hypothetical protein
MKCSAVRTFLSQINDREEPITPIPSADLDYLSVNGYVLKTSKEDYDKGVDDVARLSQIITQVNTEKAEEEQADLALRQDERKEHSFLFHFEEKEEKDELRERIQNESAVVSKEEPELGQMEANVNELIQEKSVIDRMVVYDGGYLSLTGLGAVVSNDLNVRNYRVADQEFPDFLTEIKATYAELRSIADKATSYVILLKPEVPSLEDVEYSEDGDDDRGHPVVKAPSLLWSTAIGLAKLQGDTNQIGERFIQALNALQNLDSTTPNRLMAAEIMTAASSQDVQSLESVLRNLDKQLRNQAVPKELSAGVAATIMAGRRFDGTYPVDRFTQFSHLTSSNEAASILAATNVPYDGLSSKFMGFRSLFTSWGYMTSEDTEIASAFLAIGELNADEVEEKLKHVVEQLKNYLEYPLVAAAILASIPVFESHEVLDLMEKAVTLLSGYATGLERSELVALAVRMIHGVRNELVKEIDPTAKITETPVQFTYGSHPGFFILYYPVIVAHSYYHSTFSGMGGFHPAHSHGIGGFAG